MSESPAPPTKKLTVKQELFIIEYAKDFNATQAAIRAGYTGRCINRTASQLLARTRHLVEQRQQQHQAQERERHLALQKAGGVPEPEHPPISAIATLEQSLRLVTALAFGDPRKLFDEAGNPKSPHQLTRRQALMLQAFDVEENFTKVGDKAEHTGYTKKYRLWDRTPYVQMLMKYHNAYPPPRKAEPDQADAPGSMAWKAMPIEDRLVVREKIRAVIREHLNAPKVVNGRA